MGVGFSTTEKNQAPCHRAASRQVKKCFFFFFFFFFCGGHEDECEISFHKISHMSFIHVVQRTNEVEGDVKTVMPSLRTRWKGLGLHSGPAL